MHVDVFGSRKNRKGMNIYIKTFNRPFYLDRCIRSIKFNVKGYNKIVVLEDGTLRKYQDKISQLHPDIEIRRSNADDEKFELLKNEKFSEIAARYMEPSRFWVEEVQKDDDPYFMMLEDDTWVVDELNLTELKQNMIDNSCVLAKAWWDGNKDTTRVYKYFGFASGNMLCYYSPLITNSSISFYDLWIVCMAVFKKEYFIHCFSNLKRLADEQTQLIRAVEYYKSNPSVSFARTLQRACFQGWATPGRATSEYYDLGLRFHEYMECLNEAWYNNKLDVNEGYPFDFSNEYLLSFLKETLSERSVEAWIHWKTNSVKYEYD
jgi:hypothetical protein